MLSVYGINTELTLYFDHFLKGSTFEVFFLVGDSVGFRKYALEYKNKIEFYLSVRCHQ